MLAVSEDRNGSVSRSVKKRENGETDKKEERWRNKEGMTMRGVAGECRRKRLYIRRWRDKEEECMKVTV